MFASKSSVDLAQLDLEWVQRLQAMLRFIQRGILLLAALLGLAVLLTVGNTIRLAILSRRPARMAGLPTGGAPPST